jgi:hypothetical protein
LSLKFRFAALSFFYIIVFLTTPIPGIFEMQRILPRIPPSKGPTSHFGGVSDLENFNSIQKYFLKEKHDKLTLLQIQIRG